MYQNHLKSLLKCKLSPSDAEVAGPLRPHFEKHCYGDQGDYEK